MQAVFAKGGLGPEVAGAFFLAEVADPVPGSWDLLVDVRAVSVNPVDGKTHGRMGPGEEKILGYDAVGVVAAVGAAAAAMPLTSLTAAEALFTRLDLTPKAGASAGRSILIVGGAGGVGSMAVQLAKWAGARVVATASRKQSADWCRSLGADVVLDHSRDMPAQLAAAEFPAVDRIFCTTHMEAHWQAMAGMLAPQGAVCLIDDPAGPLDLTVFKRKSASIHWEFMFARSLYRTSDMAEQGRILARVAELPRAGIVRPTVAVVRRGLSPAVVAEAHVAQRSGRMVGKQVIVY